MQVLGIDVGGSGIKGALVDLDSGKLVSDRYRLPTPENALPDAVAGVVKGVTDQFKYQGPVGAGFPAVIRQGVAFTAANIHSSWIGTNVNHLLTDATGCPFFAVNDADAAGVAEMKFGAGRHLPRGVVLMLTLGTGIGSAVFSDGILVPNTELGHLIIDGKDAEQRASDAARKRKDYSWKQWAKRLQEYMSYLESLIWPDLIIVGGGVSKQADEFLPLLNLRAKIVPAELQNHAGIIGAALYAAGQAKLPPNQ